jgi:hypothetical protein
MNEEHSVSMGRLEALLARFESERQEYDFVLPSLVSHADDYAPDKKRLERYASDVICARMMQLMAVASMKTQHFLAAYVGGYHSSNPFALFMAARASLEAFAVVWDTMQTVKKNAGSDAPHFAERVKTVDVALINATYGTRSDVIKEVFPKIRASRLRDVTTTDLVAIEAKNVLSRLDRLAKSPDYPDCRSDYDCLCEYLHPNIGQNLILTWPSPSHPKLSRVSVRSDQAMEVAVNVSLRPMEQSARGTRAVFQALQPPFGIGRIVPRELFS